MHEVMAISIAKQINISQKMKIINQEVRQGCRFGTHTF
jgi:hypothetical protein